MVYLIHTLGRYVLRGYNRFSNVRIIEHYCLHLKTGFLYIYIFIGGVAVSFCIYYFFYIDKTLYVVLR